ncbi:hypothetical protein AAC03nite_02720 [Alicyclobacillus acidoterrestris]|uniref:hypothetical protein n=1 Tax=Alicyclobacillus suci TaxID=2816080 RepID=UPI001190958D|nr:hypothetical protein [Alicyclobacillus suci]GEO24487.1 hypothetical protein AAC03nite_02720 [Alicyclobacillus acidoterrestris]
MDKQSKIYGIMKVAVEPLTRYERVGVVQVTDDKVFVESVEGKVLWVDLSTVDILSGKGICG